MIKFTADHFVVLFYLYSKQARSAIR